MHLTTSPTNHLSDVPLATLDELVQRVETIDNAYRALAEKMGQLYMRADEAGLADLTPLLDKPMRNASENHQAFVALAQTMRQQRNQRH